MHGPTRYFDQYNKAGVWLQIMEYSPILGCQGGITGAEFDLADDAQAQTVPEPGSVALCALGLAAAGLTQLRRVALRPQSPG